MLAVGACNRALRRVGFRNEIFNQLTPNGQTSLDLVLAARLPPAGAGSEHPVDGGLILGREQGRVDVGSSNGTYVNGERISGPVELGAGDEARSSPRTTDWLSSRLR